MHWSARQAASVVVVVSAVVVVVVDVDGGLASVVDVVEVLVVLDVLDVLVVLDVVVLVVVVEVVVPATHWLPSQLLPGSQPPHWIGRPQPLSISPHCAPSAGQSIGWQQTPNLSAGFSLTHIRVEQLLLT